ncbi:MAG: kelch repeat-containing protein [Gemmatimonadales bacterium]
MSPIRRVALSLAALPLLLAGSVTSSALCQATDSPPPPAWSTGVAYDLGRSRLVVFGGYFRGLIGGTWEWDGRGWMRTAVDGPSPRNAPGMVYDAARGQMLLFGGDRGQEGALGDTWVYDSSGWRRLAVAGPSARSIHAMVYDSRREKVVLFGGVADGKTLGDTWEWDGARWAQVADGGPPARALHGLAYDPLRGVTVLFGGQGILAPDEPSLGDTWEWDGSRWAERQAAPAGPRDHVAMAFNPKRQALMLFGVSADGAAGAAGGESWLYSGGAWSRLSSDGPRRGGAKLVLEPASGRMLLYGGGDGGPTNEIWAWEGDRWSLLR